MKKVLILVSLICLQCSIGLAQKAEKKAEPARHDTVTEQDYYDFYNASVNPFPVITMGGPCNPDSAKICNLLSLPEMGVLRDDTVEIFKDTLFTAADRAFIAKQTKWCKKFEWKQGKLNNENVIDGKPVMKILDSLGTDSGWHVYYRIYKLGFNKFSVPLFSVDKQRCIVFRSFECGSNFGLGNTNVFIKKNDKWVLAKSIAPWVH
jgi:hypothetical protein